MSADLSERRVVIAGMGVISSSGKDLVTLQTDDADVVTTGGGGDAGSVACRVLPAAGDDGTGWGSKTSSEARSFPVRDAVELNAGFGGRYACLIFKKALSFM